MAVASSIDATSLRHELKVWEKAFAAANGGRKPGRDDIRNDAIISAKYREYDALRKRTTAPTPVETPKKSRKSIARSPAKRGVLQERSHNIPIPSATPRRNKSSHTTEAAPADVEVAPTPAFIRSTLGPTPQKDGQVLGIFDIFTTATPSKPAFLPPVPELSSEHGTPSKHAAPSSSSDNPLSRTPQSSSKRRYLDAFSGTPVKQQTGDCGPETPSTSKRQFATPSFLRRSFPLATIAEHDADAGISGPPLKKRGLVRSLSSIIQGLRKQEEQRMDDEWDVMNELEAEERGETIKPRHVLVEDSQAVEMPLGPDEGPPMSSDEDEPNPAEGRKPWKKKGLKRQTKRTNMKPVLHKPLKAADLRTSGDVEDQGGEEVEGVERVFETQGGDGTAKPAKSVRKVSAQAHANFRALKIKNKNSKAKGRGGRFGRR